MAAVISNEHSAITRLHDSEDPDTDFDHPQRKRTRLIDDVAQVHETLDIVGAAGRSDTEAEDTMKEVTALVAPLDEDAAQLKRTIEHMDVAEDVVEVEDSSDNDSTYTDGSESEFDDAEDEVRMPYQVEREKRGEAEQILTCSQRLYDVISTSTEPDVAKHAWESHLCTLRSVERLAAMAACYRPQLEADILDALLEENGPRLFSYARPLVSPRSLEELNREIALTLVKLYGRDLEAGIREQPKLLPVEC